MNQATPGQQPPSPDLDGEHAYRQRLPHGGRVHIDRPLPFLVIARHGGAPFSLARRTAAISAASMVWPMDAGEAADADARQEVARLMEVLDEDYPRFLMVHLHDLPRDASLDEESPRLEPFVFHVGASDDAAAQSAAACLKGALEAVCIDLRDADIEESDVTPVADWTLQARATGLSHLSIGIPQIHRVPGAENRRIYPMIYHELESAIFDAILQAVAAFVEKATPDGDGDGLPGGRPHHRSLGRRRFVKAAARADRALAGISASFDFLLGVSPINTVEAYQQFEASKRQKPPVFRYRPLPLSPDVTKRRLYRIDLRAVEDPVLERIFREKQLELDQQLMMLQRRNTPQFRYVSLLQYGPVEPALLDEAKAILANVPDDMGNGPGRRLDAREVLSAAERVMAGYREKHAAFAQAEVCLRADTGPGLMVSGKSLLISTASSVPAARIDPLLQHEISVHVLTFINGSQQGLGIFGAGLADYEGIQEGLGVFAEFAVGGLTPPRLRLLAARVVVVDAMLGGADFIECHRLLHESHGFSSQGAFNIVARIFRSGGLTKDAIYLRGFHQVLRRVSEGLSLDPFWYGKIAEHHAPIVEELRTRGMLRPPLVTPEFMDRPIAKATIERLRAGESFLDLLRKPPTC